MRCCSERRACRCLAGVWVSSSSFREDCRSCPGQLSSRELDEVPPAAAPHRSINLHMYDPSMVSSGDEFE